MSKIISRLQFLTSYFSLWVLFFVLARGAFLISNLSSSQELDLVTIFKIFVYGFKMDASLASYLSFIPMLIVLMSIFFNANKILLNFINFYTALVLLLCCLLLIIDVNLYWAWGNRLDITFLEYLNTPTLMMASASNSQLVLGTFIWLLSAIASILIFSKKNINRFKNVNKGVWSESFIYIFVLGLLVIIARGGLQTIPINQSNVYFSKNMFANHAAINGIWNFGNAYSQSNIKINPYNSFKRSVAENMIKAHRDSLLDSDSTDILNTVKPNIIVIIWESLPAKIVGSLGGEKEVTPNLNRLSKEGILFTNFYGNGDRNRQRYPRHFEWLLPSNQQENNAIS